MSVRGKPSVIRRRLIWVIVLTSTVVVVLTCSAFFSYQVVTSRRSMLAHATTLARAIAANSTAALAFENPTDAEEVLAAFKADPTVEFAALIGTDGTVFARYPRRVAIIVPTPAPAEGVHFYGRKVVAWIPVAQNRHLQLGTLYFSAETTELYDALLVYGSVSVLILVLAMTIAYVIGRALQRQISEPILELAQVAAAVSERQDYGLRVATVGDGELGQLTTTFNDMLAHIAEQTRSLTISEGRHRMLFENSPLPMWVYDLASRRFLAVNAAATLGYGYSASEFLAMTIDEIRPASERPALAQDMAETPPTGIRTSPRLWQHLRKDGTTIVVEITSHDLRFGERPARLVLASDVTSRVHAEQEIRRLNQELEERVRQRTAQLEQANRELEAFSYSVSHDLRAPLRHVQGYVSMLQRAVEGQLPDRAKRYLKTINDASIEMGQLIDDLLEFSRMGRTEIRESTVALDHLVHECMPQVNVGSADRRIDWKIAPLPVVRGDPAMLRQVFVNLLSNAVKYTRHRDPALIELATAGTEAQRVICFIRDNGAGFDMQYAHKLFGVFQRLHRSDEFEGTGIGLATVRRIIGRHGGRIWAEGAVDKGATFYFTLALANPPPPDAPPLQ